MNRSQWKEAKTDFMCSFSIFQLRDRLLNFVLDEAKEELTVLAKRTERYSSLTWM